jgi:hypothetical protein
VTAALRAQVLSVERGVLRDPPLLRIVLRLLAFYSAAHHATLEAHVQVVRAPRPAPRGG